MSRVLIAGATGFLGKRIVEQSALQGHETYAISRPESVSKLDSLTDSLSGIHAAELTDADGVAAAMAGMDAVVTTVGMTRPESGMDPEKVDYAGNMALLKAAQQSNVGHFSYVSLDGVDLPGADEIAVIRAKKRFEEALQASNLPWAICRPNGFFWNYGIDLTMARDSGVMRLVGDGSAKTTPIDEDELAEAIVQRVGAKDVIYSVGGPQDLTFNEVADLISRVLGKKLKVKHYPRNVTGGILKVMHPFAPERADLLQMFVWLMNANVTSDHVGHRRLGDWLEQNKDKTFTM